MAGKKKKTRAASRSDLAWLFSDLPADAEKLRFEFEPLAKTLAELALNPGNKTPFTVVVRRGWGRGKTTLLKRAQRMVEKPAEHRVTEAPGLRRVETLWFNAWKYPDEDTVLAGLLGALLDKLHRGGWKSQLKALVAEYRGSVLAAALRAAAPPGLKELLDVESRFGPAEEKHAFYDAFRQLFAELSWILFHGVCCFRRREDWRLGPRARAGRGPALAVGAPPVADLQHQHQQPFGLHAVDHAERPDPDAVEVPVAAQLAPAARLRGLEAGSVRAAGPAGAASYLSGCRQTRPLPGSLGARGTEQRRP